MLYRSQSDLKTCEVAQGTPTGDALREWLQSFEPKEPEDQTKSTKSTKPTSEDDPTANTKMIT